MITIPVTRQQDGTPTLETKEALTRAISSLYHSEGVGAKFALWEEHGGNVSVSSYQIADAHPTDNLILLTCIGGDDTIYVQFDANGWHTHWEG